MFEIEFYSLPNGRKPVEDFMDSLPAKLRSKAIDSIKILRQYGNQLREPYSKPVGDGIFELRIKFASDISRIFYFFFIGNKIVLTNAYIKKTPKAPPGEIKLAKKYKADYERRNRHG